MAFSYSASTEKVGTPPLKNVNSYQAPSLDRPKNKMLMGVKW